MRLRILARPTETLAGISPERFEVGGVYDIRSHVACVYLAKGWAEAADEGTAPVVRPPPDARVRIKGAVLVFDDDAHLRRFTRQLLTYRGYSLVVTRHGEEAIEQLRQDCRGLMVLDLMTPIVNGCTFRVEEVYLTHTRVAASPVLLQAREDEARVYGVSVDAMAIVRTPFDPEALLQALA